MMDVRMDGQTDRQTYKPSSSDAKTHQMRLSKLGQKEVVLIKQVPRGYIRCDYFVVGH